MFYLLQAYTFSSTMLRSKLVNTEYIFFVVLFCTYTMTSHSVVTTHYCSMENSNGNQTK